MPMLLELSLRKRLASAALKELEELASTGVGATIMFIIGALLDLFSVPPLLCTPDPDGES